MIHMLLLYMIVMIRIPPLNMPLLKYDIFLSYMIHMPLPYDTHASPIWYTCFSYMKHMPLLYDTHASPIWYTCFSYMIHMPLLYVIHTSTKHVSFKIWYRPLLDDACLTASESSWWKEVTREKFDQRVLRTSSPPSWPYPPWSPPLWPCPTVL